MVAFEKLKLAICRARRAEEEATLRCQPQPLLRALQTHRCDETWEDVLQTLCQSRDKNVR